MEMAAGGLKLNRLAPFFLHILNPALVKLLIQREIGWKAKG